ncbi:MAG: hypothetical protein K5886_06495, partial [Lachnospiraceae bacterium]|nr:hypothetical protein [Lachnospiraceae bacterium]
MNTEALTDDGKELYDWIKQKARDFTDDGTFADELMSRVLEKKELYEEIDYYRLHEDFLCTLKVKGMTVVDILVWQTDRFKAAIDEGKFGLKYNPSEMILKAYYTMYDVMRDPELYFEHFRSETGTDYEGKKSCFTKPSA